MCSEIIGECQSGHAPQKYENGCLIMDGAENRRGMHTYERIFEGGGCAYEVFQIDITADCNSYDKCRTEHRTVTVVAKSSSWPSRMWQLCWKQCHKSLNRTAEERTSFLPVPCAIAAQPMPIWAHDKWRWNCGREEGRESTAKGMHVRFTKVGRFRSISDLGIFVWLYSSFLK